MIPSETVGRGRGGERERREREERVHAREQVPRLQPQKTQVSAQNHSLRRLRVRP